MTCNYVNCENEIENKKGTAKYCCINHQKMQYTYRKRAKKVKGKMGRPVVYKRLRELTSEDLDRLRKITNDTKNMSEK